MKVKQIKQQGELVWLVDGKINGKRKRMFFESEPKAKAWLAAEERDTTCQRWWLELSNADRVDMMNSFQRSRDIGFTLLSAVDHFAIEGSGKKFLEKKTIGDAVGAAGKENRYAEEPEPSGFLGDKLLSGMPPHSLSTLKSALYSFVRFAGPGTQCSLITPAHIKKWLAHPEHGGKLQKVTKAGNIGRLGQLCNWLI